MLALCESAEVHVADMVSTVRAGGEMVGSGAFTSLLRSGYQFIHSFWQVTFSALLIFVAFL